jgi:surface carbohydrate biosynthesis protein
MRSVDIAFLYEHAARELDVACAAAAVLRQSGVSVEVIHWPTGFPGAVRGLRPKLVVLPFCYTERGYEALLAYWWEAAYFNMTWEQLLYLGNRRAKTPRGDFVTRNVIHHAWGNSYAAFLGANGIGESRIFLNGQPAYALYAEPYRRYFKSRSELAALYGLDASRRWIFFPESYDWAFFSKATLRTIIKDGQPADDVRTMKEFCDRSLREVVIWCARAADAGNVELILRPRPSTILAEFVYFIRQVLPGVPKHMHVIQEESVREWILVSDSVVSSHSTSLIEAAVAGKPVHIMEPVPIPAVLHAEWHDLLPHIGSAREFVEVCVGEAVEEDARLMQWARTTLMTPGDAIKNLTDYLASIVRGEEAAPPPVKRWTATPTLTWIPPRWLWSYYRQLKQYLRNRETGGVEPEYVKDALPSRQVEERIRRWSQVIFREDS